MNLTVNMQIATEHERPPPSSAIEQWATAAVTGAISEHKKAAELTIRIVDTVEITQLNHQYRGKDLPTNVLSFPADLPDYIDLPLLGDLVICASVVETQAQQQNKTSQAHWAHMVIHGTLHLLGYDHINDDDASIMEQLEIDILSSLNFANPYIIHDNHLPKTLP